MNALNQLQALGLELIVIPPLFADSVIGERFSTPAEHKAAISDVQRFRGCVYVADGAIPASALDDEGRHYQEFDFENYHLCLRNSDRGIQGSFRLSFYEPEATAEDLRLFELVDRMPTDFVHDCRAALEALFVSSHAEGIHLVEAGGWAVAEELRQSRAAILTPLAGWALCQIKGNALVAAAATTRHHSSAILKRIGGFSLMNDGEELPPFMDDYHGCEMQLLGFDSRKPDPKYEKMVADLKSFLLTKVHQLSTTQCDRQIEENADFQCWTNREPAYA